MNFEHDMFTPLVFSVNGSMARECSTFHKYLAEKIVKKSDCCYEKVMSVIKCKLSFLILRVSLTSARRSRSLTKHSESQ